MSTFVIISILFLVLMFLVKFWDVVFYISHIILLLTLKKNAGKRFNKWLEMSYGRL